MNHFNRLLYLLTICIVWSSCTTEESGYISQMIKLPTDLPVTDICFITKDTGFLSTGSLFTSGEIYQTTNGGKTWNIHKKRPVGVNSLDYSNGQLSYVQSGNLLERSNDQGNTWQGSIALAWWQWNNHIKLPNGDAILVGGENFGRGFMHRHSLGQNQLTLTDTFDHELKDIVYTADRRLYVVGYGLVTQSTDQGQTWQSKNVVGDFFVAVDFPSSQKGYILGQYGSVYKTTNAGDNWSSIRAGNSLFANASQKFTDLAFWGEERGFMVGSNNQVWQTKDGGGAWKQITDLGGWADFECVTVTNNQAYIGARDGKVLIIDLE